MKAHYVQAFLETLKAGTAVDTALAGLQAVLKRKKHEKLLPAILLETQRILEAQKGVQHAVVKTASTADASALASEIKTALAALGSTSSTPVTHIVDETLVGGFVTTFNYQEHDQSFKKALKSLYESITK